MYFETIEDMEHFSDDYEELRKEATRYGASVDEYLMYVDDYAESEGKLWH